MEHKNIVATIYIKDGMAVKSPTELDDKSDVLELASVYDDSGIRALVQRDYGNQFCRLLKLPLLRV